MNQTLPLRCIYEVGRGVFASDGIEACTPGVEIVEIHGWRPSKNAVEVVWVHFSSFNALTATKRAAQVVGFVLWLLVEEIDELFADRDARVQTLRFVNLQIMIEESSEIKEHSELTLCKQNLL